MADNADFRDSPWSMAGSSAAQTSTLRRPGSGRESNLMAHALEEVHFAMLPAVK